MMYTQSSNDLGGSKKKIAVIGAGAAGLLCAAECGRRGASVTLFEKNEKVGRKLAITGKGRCNLTNNCEPDEFIKNIVSNPRFMMSAIYGFSPSDTMALFESLGVELKTERGRRVFPLSDRSYDIVDALWKYAREHAEIKHERVTDISVSEGRVCGVQTERHEYGFDCVIVATGGKSYPLTGSSGDGYAFAKKAGHTVTALSPSLVPITSSSPACKALMGLSLKNSALKITDDRNGKCVYEDFGEMLFTHFGLSGPMILSASSHLHNIHPSHCSAVIDMKPALDAQTLDTRLLAVFGEAKNKNFENAIQPLMPAKLASYIPSYIGVDPKKKVNEITKDERRRLLEALKSFKVKLSGFRPIEEAIITRGGVNVKEIDPKSMGSKICDGLYFIGEVLDVDAYTGGYNLQIAFSCAYAAAKAAIHQ